MELNDILSGRLVYSSCITDSRLREWILNSTELSVLYYVKTALTPPDEVVCRVLQDAGGSMSMEELGLTLGFDVATKEFNGQQYYRDNAEYSLFERLLNGVEKWLLIVCETPKKDEDSKAEENHSEEGDSDEDSTNKKKKSTKESVVRLTSLGVTALERHEKYKFYKGTAALYSNQLNIHDIEADKIFPFKEELGITTSLTAGKEDKDVDPNSVDIDDTSEWINRLMRQLDSIGDKHIYSATPINKELSLGKSYVDIRLYEYEGEYYPMVFKGEQMCPEATKTLNKNARPKEIKIERALYYKLLNNPNAVFTSNEVETFWDILEKEEFMTLLRDSRLQWDDPVLFDMIVQSEYCDNIAWGDVSRVCPTEVIKRYIEDYTYLFDWLTLSQRMEVSYIIGHPKYPWNYSIVLSRDDVSQEQGQTIMLIPMEEEWEWETVSRFLTPEFVRANIDRLNDGLFYNLTSWLSQEDRNIVTTHPDKLWDYDYLTKVFSLHEIEGSEALQGYINVSMLLDRCFSEGADEEDRNFIISSQVLRVMTAEAAQSLRLVTYTLRDKSSYHWSDDVIEFFESTGLLHWQSESLIKGFCQFPFVHWDAEFFVKYHSKLTTMEDIAYVCGEIDDGSLITQYPDFDWDWSSLSSNKRIALDRQFIEAYALKIIPETWVSIAPTELVEEYFDTLHLERNFKIKQSADDLSEKVSTSFMLVRIDLPWSEFPLTRAICTAPMETVELIEVNASRINWKEVSQDIRYEDFLQLAERYADRFDWEDINNRFTKNYDNTLLSISAVQDKVDWQAVTAQVAIAVLEKLVHSHPDRIDWHEATRRLCPTMTMQLLADNTERWVWDYLSKNVTIALVEEGISSGSLKWDWKVVTGRLDAGFIFDNFVEYQDKWDYDKIWDEKFTVDFLRERLEDIPSKFNSLADEKLRLRIWTVATGKFEGEELLSIANSHTPENGYHWDYRQVYQYVNDIDSFVAVDHVYVDWQALSGSSAADKYFAYNPDFAYQLWKKVVKGRIENVKCQWNFSELTQLNSIQERFPTIYGLHEDGWNWSFISAKGLCLTEKYNGKDNMRKFKDKIDFSLLSTRTDIDFTKELLTSFIDEAWDYGALSANGSMRVPIGFVFEHREKAWDWHAISGNASIIWEKEALHICRQLVKNESICTAFDWDSFVARPDVDFDGKLIHVIHKHIVDFWQTLSSNTSFIPSEAVLDIAERDGVDLSCIDWTSVSLSRHIIEGEKQADLAFVKRYADHLVWTLVTRNPVFDINKEWVVEQFKDLVDWSYISNNCKTDNVAYLCKFKTQLDWTTVNPRLDYQHVWEYIDELKDYLDWTKVSGLKLDFTEEILDKYARYWDWATLVNNNAFKSVFTGELKKKYKPQYNVATYYNLFTRSNPKIYHFTHLFNVIDILKSRKILSRDSAMEQGLLKYDSAGGVVFRTSKAHRFARFYFRPNTPTQFYNECLGWDAFMSVRLGNKYYSYYDRANGMGLPKCPLPVFLEFDLREVLTKMPDCCYYSNGNMQASYTSVYKVEEEPSHMKMEYLYNNMDEAYGMTLSKGGWDLAHFHYLLDAIKHQSQQEFLVEGEFDFSNIQSLRIHCYDKFSADMLCRYLGDDHVIVGKIDANGWCFSHENRQLTFSVEDDGENLDIRSDYDGQGDAYFRVEGDVEIVNNDDVKRQTPEGIIAYPEVTIRKTSNPYRVYFIDERARTKKWLIYQN